MKYMLDLIRDQGRISPISMQWLLSFAPEKIDINCIEPDTGDNILGAVVKWHVPRLIHEGRPFKRKQLAITNLLLQESELDITHNNHSALRASAKVQDQHLYSAIKGEYQRRGIPIPEDINISVVGDNQIAQNIQQENQYRKSDKPITIIARTLGESLGDMMAVWRLIKQCLANNKPVNFILYHNAESPFKTILKENMKFLSDDDKLKLNIIYTDIPLLTSLQLNNHEIYEALKQSAVILPYPRQIFLNEDDIKFVEDNKIILGFLGEYDYSSLHDVEGFKEIRALAATGFEEDNKGVFINELKNTKDLSLPEYFNDFDSKLQKNELTNKFTNLFFAYFHLSEKPSIVLVDPLRGYSLFPDKYNDYAVDQPNIANFIDYAIEQGNVNGNNEIIIVAPFKKFNKRLEKVDFFEIKKYEDCPTLQYLLESQSFYPPHFIVHHDHLYCYGMDDLGNQQLTEIKDSKFKDHILTLMAAPEDTELFYVEYSDSYSLYTNHLSWFNSSYVTDFLEETGAHFEKSNKLWVDEYIHFKNLNLHLRPNDEPDSMVQYTIERNGITAYLVDPFPLSTEDFNTFMQLSDNPALITGDQSLSDAISQNKLFLYQIMPWKHDLFYEMTEFMKKKGLFELSNFMLSQQNKKNEPIIWKDILLAEDKKEILREEIKQFREYVAQEKNAYVEVPLWLNEIQHQKVAQEMACFSNQECNTEILLEKQAEDDYGDGIFDPISSR